MGAITKIDNSSKLTFDPSKIDQRLAIDMLKIAKKDLEASSHLYTIGYYPHAIFSLQQGMEKACKAFGFYFGIITLDEAAKKEFVNHTGTNVYKLTSMDLKKYLIIQRIFIM